MDDAASAVGWLAEAGMGGQSPQQLQQGFQQIGISAEDFMSWWNYAYVRQGAQGQSRLGQDLGQWLTRAPGSQPQQAQKPAAPAVAQGQLGKPKNLTDAQWQVVQGVLRAAQELGIPSQLALAIAQKESEFDGSAVGDNGCSIGVMQLNTCGGEGAGLPDYVLHDPYLNARTALQQVKQVMQQHPDWSMGQIAAAAQRPGDPQGYAGAINNFVDSIQTGQGPLGWAQSITTGTLSQRQNMPGGSSQVPLPFSGSYFQSISQSFGQNGEQGTDFAMPEGQSMVSPVGGVVTTRDDGNRNWGRAVYVKMPNGWTYFVGHMMDFAVQDGQTVGPGQVLGTSGGGPQSVSPGESTGPHVEVRFIDPSGQNQDPMPFLQQLFSPSGSGASASNLFSNWMGGMFQGSAQVTPTEAQQNLATTPDHRLVDLNSPQGQWYQAVDSVWRSVFGMHAPLQASVDFQHAGVRTVQQIQDAVNGLDSGVVPGVSIGSFNALGQAVNTASNQALGRPAPQSLVKQFFNEGITTPSDIKLWFESHSSADIPPAELRQTWDAMNQYTQQVWGDYPHPNDVSQVWQQSGGTPVPSNQLPPQDQVAKTIADYVAGVF
jgi:murein DD-endopeptidase MepM/ murein hydrolase activator NlpD